MIIRFLNHNIKFNLRFKKRIREKLIKISEIEGFLIGEINIIFTSDINLLKINQKYLSHNYLTDILTFDYSVKNILNGEIYISIIRIRDNSKLYNVSFDNELYRVIIHGFLHLIKYDDLNIKDKIEMKKKENFYLNEFKDLFIVINKAKI